MSQKFSKSQILNEKFKGKRIREKIRDKYRSFLEEKKGLSSSEAKSISSSQIKTKKSLAELLKRKSERARKKIYKEMGLSYRDKKAFEGKHFSGGKLSKHEMVLMKKKYERVKNRNLTQSKRQRKELSAIMGDDEVNLNPSQKINDLRKEMSAKENVKDTAENRLGVNYRKGVTNFAGQSSIKNKNNNSGFADKLSGGNKGNVTGGSSIPGGGDNLLKFR